LLNYSKSAAFAPFAVACVILLIIVNNVRVGGKSRRKETTGKTKT
jgi:hypothetical protein